MKTFTLAQRENCGKTPPSAELLKIIEDEDKKPPECDKTFNYGICKIRHAKAVRDYKAAIATGAKRPRKEPCYFCQLITDKITEEAQKAKGENAIEYEDEEEADKVPAKVVTQKVTKEIDHESNGLVQVNKKQTKEEKPKDVKPETIKCAYCGKEFSPESPKNKYCSIKCRDKRNNEKRVERYRKSTQSKAKEPDESIYYVSPKHALTCLSDSLQGFNDVVDLIRDQTDGVISKLAVYLSDDIYETNKRIKSYLDRLEGTSS